MNYLWEALLKAKEEGIDIHKLKFKIAKSYSPYLELAQEELNNIQIKEDVPIELNPYYRFEEIFKEITSQELEQYPALQQGLFQILIAMIGENDLKRGMNRAEYEKKFLYQDIMSGCYKEEMKKAFLYFTKEQQQIILEGMRHLYTTGASIDLLRHMLISLFPDSILYHHKSQNELLIYIREEKTEEIEKQVKTVSELFGDMKYNIEIYYQYHFAILGVDDTCRIDEIALYGGKSYV